MSALKLRNVAHRATNLSMCHSQRTPQNPWSLGDQRSPWQWWSYAASHTASWPLALFWLCVPGRHTWQTTIQPDIKETLLWATQIAACEHVRIVLLGLTTLPTCATISAQCAMSCASSKAKGWEELQVKEPSVWKIRNLPCQHLGQRRPGRLAMKSVMTRHAKSNLSWAWRATSCWKLSGTGWR